jgi:hypothetical protein
VKALRAAGLEHVSQGDIAQKLGSNKASANRWCRAALKGGWLVNNDSRPRRYDYDLGDPLPADDGLPSVAALEDMSFTVSPPTGGISAVKADPPGSELSHAAETVPSAPETALEPELKLADETEVKPGHVCGVCGAQAVRNIGSRWHCDQPPCRVATLNKSLADSREHQPAGWPA